MIMFKILPHGLGIYPNLEVDGYATEVTATPGSCALDLRTTEDISIRPGQCLPIKTGLAFDLALAGLCVGGLVLPRSGLGSKGLILGNSVGLIDNDYQGEVMVFAWNRTEDQTFNLKKGERFAQLAFLQFQHISSMHRVKTFSSETARGEGGFGSTGAS